MLLEKAIGHRNFESAVNLAQVYAVNAPPGALVFCVGPSGAGKSTLLRHLRHSLYGGEAIWADGQIHVVSVSADNSERGYFSSKDLFSRMLTAIGDPFRGSREDIVAHAGNAKEPDVELSQFLEEPFWKSIRLGMTEMQFRRAFVRQAHARALRALLIDEAQMMLLVHGNRSPSDYLESLKCLAQELGILIFFFGTYDLLDVWNHSAQLNRRTRLIEIPRYRSEDAEDRKEFARILRQLGTTIQTVTPGLLHKLAPLLFAKTGGVFGELEAVLERARDLAQAERSEAVGLKHIERSFLTDVQLQRLADEIVRGEKRVKGEIERPVIVQPPVTAKTKKRGGRPGRRNPVRDACGGAS